MNDLYDAPEQEQADMPKEGEDGQDGMDNQTALVNKELCPDCMPGDKLIVEVVKDHGKELEIRYVSKEGEGEEDKSEMSDKPMPDDSQQDSESLMM